jgi:hypothetical protein
MCILFTKGYDIQLVENLGQCPLDSEIKNSPQGKWGGQLVYDMPLWFTQSFLLFH